MRAYVINNQKGFGINWLNDDFIKPIYTILKSL